MEKYNTKKDLNTITNILLSTGTLIAVFLLFAVLVILPVYLLSKYSIRLYTYLAITLFISIMAVFSVKKITKICKEYKNIKKILIKIIFSWIIVFISLMFFAAEALFFSIIKYLILILDSKNTALTDLLSAMLYYEKIIYIATLSLNLLNPVILFISVFLLINALLFKLIFEIIPWFLGIPAVFIISSALIILIIISLRRIYFSISSYLKK